jgi:hypothetical protein
MPNWVFNSLIIEDSPEKIKEIAEVLARPHETTYHESKWDESTGKHIQEPQIGYVNQSISFWNIIAPENLDEYFNKADADTLNNPLNWYEWNITNWGTKWNACEAQDVHFSEDGCKAYYNFDTAWSPPIPAILKLSEKFPTSKITLDYQEETGWAGVCEFFNGALISEDLTDAEDFDQDDEENDEYVEAEEEQ